MKSEDVKYLEIMTRISDRAKKPVSNNLLTFCMGLGFAAFMYIAIAGVLGAVMSFNLVTL